ncbi:Growth-regulating factor 12 [Morella rubra]|uniref:Growth-regulating factor n=1 Tax=Morella rubra TaxID=262757 RepID=A0A6A1VWK0_9ROSI|nr:Growth-regulating factor 12 [Morella rubra]
MSMNGSTVGDGSPPVGLNLELGRGSGHSTKSSGFTIIQLQELRLQALIYKYMEAGLPVPYHLLFPLWKSVASSLGGLSDEVPPGHTSFLGSSTLSWDYRSRTDSDPEPGRCRRTDGKKWRCSKDAAPLKKYCERHMQRGRQRSRKLVDQPSQHLNTSTENAPSANTNLSISLSTDSSSSTVSPRWGFCPNTVLHGGGRYPENNAL